MITVGNRPVYNLSEIRDLAKGFNPNSLLKHHAYQNRPLDFDRAYLLGVFTLYPYKKSLADIFEVEPSVAEKQSIAILCSLHNKETYKRNGASDQIAGIAAAVFDYDIGTSEYGFLEADILYAMDNCGMGGDLYRTPNVSTTAALIAAADGIKICKHGSPGNTDSTGSSDFLEYCGLNLLPERKTVKDSLLKFNFGYIDALDVRYKTVHMQTHRSAHLAHMNDVIGPITNPLNPNLMKKRVLGVNHLIDTSVVADAYRILNEKGVTNVEHGMFVRGFVDEGRNGGIDEVSIFKGGTSVAELVEGKVKCYDLYPEDFGLIPQKYFEPPAGKEGKAKFSKDILAGRISGAPRDLILANTAILQYLAYGVDFENGFKMSRDLLESGRPIKNLENYIEFTRNKI